MRNSLCYWSLLRWRLRSTKVPFCGFEGFSSSSLRSEQLHERPQVSCLSSPSPRCFHTEEILTPRQRSIISLFYENIHTNARLSIRLITRDSVVHFAIIFGLYYLLIDGIPSLAGGSYDLIATLVYNVITNSVVPNINTVTMWVLRWIGYDIFLVSSPAMSNMWHA